MKRCDKCGALNADDRFFCVDCDTKLGDPLNDAQQAAAEKQLDANLEKQYHRKDALHVSLFDKLVAVLCGVCGIAFVASLTLLAVKGALPEEWGAMTLLCLFVLALAVIDCLFPQFFWTLTRFRTGFLAHGTEGLTPSALYFYGRRIGNVLLLVIGCRIVMLLWQGAGIFG